MNTDEGVLYVAYGRQYYAEARRSIRSLRKVCPAVPVAVITDHEWTEEPLPDKFIIREGTEDFAAKQNSLMSTPFRKTLYIDTDTVIARDLSKVFGLLDFYDLGINFWGPPLKTEPGLEMHSQVQGGVILYQNNDEVWRTFEFWIDLYRQKEKSLIEAGVQLEDRRGLDDQRYLTIALARSRLRTVHLGDFLNFVLFGTTITYSPPIIYHGRIPEMEQLHDTFSKGWDETKDWHPRLWMQNIRGRLPQGLRRSDPLLGLALICRRLWNEIKWRVIAFKEKF